MNKPHADLGLRTKEGGWDTTVWFRVDGVLLREFC